MKAKSRVLDKISIVYTTINVKETAIQMAEIAIKEKYAACVNILPGAISLYEWEGKLENTEEYLMIFKTSMEKSVDLKEWILKNHPYEVPVLLFSEILSNSSFKDFVTNNTAS